MAARKVYRNLKVGDIYKNGRNVPMLRFTGLWLEELGFISGRQVIVKCEDGQIVITPDVGNAEDDFEGKVVCCG